MAKQVFRPKVPFVCSDPKGDKRRFDSSTLVSEGHWVLKGRADLFDPVEDTVDSGAPVEQATAAPGERRSTRRPPPKKSADVEF